jgi:hypothetical protein
MEALELGSNGTGCPYEVRRIPAVAARLILFIAPIDFGEVLPVSAGAERRVVFGNKAVKLTIF